VAQSKSQEGGGFGKITASAAPGTSFPPGTTFQALSCYNHVCSAYFPAGTQVTLHAEAVNNGLWRDWTGEGCENAQDDCTVIMDGPKLVTANFFEGPRLKLIVTGGTPNTFVATVGYAPLIVGSPPALKCMDNCDVTGRFRRGASVVISLSTPPIFGAWGGNCDGTLSISSTCTITMGSELSDNVIKTVTVRYQ
jgi:hypothetical protein